jgi:hypothetical protein
VVFGDPDRADHQRNACQRQEQAVQVGGQRLWGGLCLTGGVAMSLLSSARPAPGRQVNGGDAA